MGTSFACASQHVAEPNIPRIRSEEAALAIQARPRQAENIHADNPDIERIYNEWDAALAKNDTDAILALYSPNAELESPLVPHLMGTATGVCRGRDELQKFFQVLATRKPKLRQFYRTGYFTDGRKVI